MLRRPLFLLARVQGVALSHRDLLCRTSVSLGVWVLGRDSWCELGDGGSEVGSHRSAVENFMLWWGLESGIIP